MATDAHSECVILLAFRLQICLHEQASILRYTYVACVANITFVKLLHYEDQ